MDLGLWEHTPAISLRERNLQFRLFSLTQPQFYKGAFLREVPKTTPFQNVIKCLISRNDKPSGLKDRRGCPVNAR